MNFYDEIIKLRNGEEIESHGKYEYEGKILYLTQDPYLNELCNQDPAYYAHAVDYEGNEYRLRFEIICPDCEDESEACDWEKYTVTKL